jgi:hypothetical protein
MEWPLLPRCDGLHHHFGNVHLSNPRLLNYEISKFFLMLSRPNNTRVTRTRSKFFETSNDLPSSPIFPTGFRWPTSPLKSVCALLTVFAQAIRRRARRSILAAHRYGTGLSKRDCVWPSQCHHRIRRSWAACSQCRPSFEIRMVRAGRRLAPGEP